MRFQLLKVSFFLSEFPIVLEGGFCGTTMTADGSSSYGSGGLDFGLTLGFDTRTFERKGKVIRGLTAN